MQLIYYVYYMKELYFSGAGGFYPYFMGIAYFIQNNYNLDDIIFTGNSSSSLVTLLLALKIPIDEALNENYKIMKEISNFTFGPLFNYYEIAKKYIYKYFEENMDIDPKKINNLYIQITNTNNSYNPQNWESIFINKWESLDDLFNCIKSSSYIPIFGKTLTNEFRNMKCIDGGVNYYLKNSSHSTCKFKKNKYIHTNIWRNIPISWYLIYSDKIWNEKLYIMGYEDAKKNKKELDDFFFS